MKDLQIAVVGAGLIGKAHIRTVLAQPGCQLLAIADPSDMAVELAEQCDVAHFKSIEALLAARSPDGIILATPNHLHVSQASLCLETGVPTLLEKPVATTCAEAEVLAEVVSRTGIPLLVGHHRAHGDIMSRACDVISSGQLGRLVSIMGSAQFSKPAGYFHEAPWRMRAGGGPILINMIHEIHNLRMLMGEITEVQAFSSQAARDFPVEDTVSMNFRFASGALGTFMLSDTAASTHSWEQTSGENPAYARYPEDDCYLIAGTRGSLSIPTMRIRRVSSGQEASWWQPLATEVVSVEEVDPLARQLAHFLDVVRHLAMPLVSVTDGLNNLRVIEAILEAADTGLPVRPDQTVKTCCPDSSSGC